MYEETRARIEQCYVYKVPPRARAEGYKAADWDLTNHIWTGQAIVKSKGNVCIVRLEGHDATAYSRGECLNLRILNAASTEDLEDATRIESRSAQRLSCSRWSANDTHRFIDNQRKTPLSKPHPSQGYSRANESRRCSPCLEEQATTCQKPSKQCRRCGLGFG